jgi:hypothetical protein
MGLSEKLKLTILAANPKSYFFGDKLEHPAFFFFHKYFLLIGHFLFLSTLSYPIS